MWLEGLCSTCDISAVGDNGQILREEEKRGGRKEGWNGGRREGRVGEMVTMKRMQSREADVMEVKEEDAGREGGKEGKKDEQRGGERDESPAEAV